MRGLRSTRIAAVCIAWCASGSAALGQQSEDAILAASDASSFDLLGLALATSTDLALVGAPADDHSGGIDAGAVYLFAKSGSVWSEGSKLVAGDASAGVLFGSSLALSGADALIGAYRGEAVYVFSASGAVWGQQQKLVASDGVPDDYFGFSVALFGDTAIVGAFRDESLRGAAYLFERVGSTWSESAKLVAGDGLANDRFGFSVAIEGDRAFVGAPGADAIAGAVYVYARSGAAWVFQQKIVAADRTADAWFGHDLAISGDTLVVGSPEDPSTGSGAAYVFEPVSATWVEQQKLQSSDLAIGDGLGRSVAIEDDAIVLGARWADHSGRGDAGAAYVFSRAGGSWSQTRKLVSSDPQAGDSFGDCVALHHGTVLVGAPADDTLTLTNAGAAYVFGIGVAATEPRAITVLFADQGAPPDLVIANSATHDLSLWTNDGTGTLSESRIALEPTNRAPIALAAGDLDDDGFADDVAVACADSHSVARVLDLGGTPIASTQTCRGLQPTCVAVGDLDADGRDEVVVGREGTPFSGGSGLAVSWNGAAFTELPIPNGRETRVQKLALLDLDGDGDNDLVALAHGSPDELLLFAGDGAGALVFADAIALATSGFASGLCAGDFDGDGDADLAVALATLFPLPATELRILSHDGSSALQASAYSLSPPIATGGVLATDLACGELEDDSIPGFLSRRDLIVVHGGSGDARVFSGWDGAAFQSTRSLTVGQNPIAAAVGDLDGDGGDDVVIVNQGSSDLSVNLTVQPALAQTYGTGCPGTGALTPLLAGSGTPLSGSTSFALELEQARSFAPMLLLYSFGLADLALGGGCELYLELPAGSLLLFADGGGSATLGLSVPPDPLLLGGDAYFQAAVFDPAGAFAATLAFSNGVRLQVGS
ncbi:MAG: FG-GAP repeat protein [Planctomycetes bacterium]|nr:FG-GAP repeat protein [Planctomycetota bacterium]